MSFRTFPCRLRRVIDGDTVVVDVDHGFSLYSTQHVRVLGVNTPELNEAGGAAARDFTTGWLNGADRALEWPLVLEASSTKDKYGRRLGRLHRFGIYGDLATDLITTRHTE